MLVDSNALNTPCKQQLQTHYYSPVDDTTLYCLFLEWIQASAARSHSLSTSHTLVFTLFPVSPPVLFLSHCLVSGGRIPLISGICSHYK